MKTVKMDDVAGNPANNTLIVSKCGPVCGRQLIMFYFTRFNQMMYNIHNIQCRRSEQQASRVQSHFDFAQLRLK